MEAKAVPKFSSFFKPRLKAKMKKEEKVMQNNFKPIKPKPKAKMKKEEKAMQNYFNPFQAFILINTQ